MKMELKMSLKEADRLAVMRQLETSKISIAEAARELNLSYKQAHRIWKQFQKDGPAGLISKLKGKPSNNQTPVKTREKALKLIRRHYFDYGPTLVKEKLEEKHSLLLSKETLRQLMIQEGIWQSKKAKKRKTFSRRTRRSCVGDLEQIDGSYEYWFEDRAEKCCLLVCVDDATSRLMNLKFCKVESTEDYLKFIKDYLLLHGRPKAFYSDKHSVFRVNHKQRNEGNFTTRFHEVLKKLDVELICAHSPQAKGRVERANGVLQDRLIKEMREKGISSMEEGNAFLRKFQRAYNKKFAKQPADSRDSHRELLPSHDMNLLFMEKGSRVLSKDLSFQYKGQIYQIISEYRHRLPGKAVEAYEKEGEVCLVLLQGKELKYQKWQELANQPAKTVDTKELEILWPTRKRKPGKYHPWR